MFDGRFYKSLGWPLMHGSHARGGQEEWLLHQSSTSNRRLLVVSKSWYTMLNFPPYP